MTETPLSTTPLCHRARSGVARPRTRLTLIGAFLTLSDCVARYGHADAVKALIKAGAALDATGFLGWTALHAAALPPRAIWSGAGLARTRLTLIGVPTLSDCVASEGHADVVEALIKAGAALDATMEDGTTALICAALSPRARWSGAGLARTRLTLIDAFLSLSD